LTKPLPVRNKKTAGPKIKDPNAVNCRGGKASINEALCSDTIHEQVSADFIRGFDAGRENVSGTDFVET
jgi:hypothetical protein